MISAILGKLRLGTQEKFDFFRCSRPTSPGVQKTHYKIFAQAAVIVILASAAMAQDASILPYMNPKLTPEERAADLVHRMTLEEKASQLVNQARACATRA
jgi:hypothetical protein